MSLELRVSIEMVVKVIGGYLAINWKTKEVKYTKRKPKVGGYWISLKMNLELIIPEPEEFQVNGKIIIPEAKAKEIVIENL